MTIFAKFMPMLVVALMLIVQGCNQTTSQSSPAIKTQNDPMSSFVIPAAADLKLLSTGKIDKKICTRFGLEPYGTDTIKIVREPRWPNQSGSAHQFIHKNAQHLAYALTTKKDTDKEFVSRLLKAVDSNAYTVLDFETVGGGSPAFLTAVLIKSISYSVSYLDSKQALTDAQRTTIFNWVKKLKGNVYARKNSPDHKAAIATSLIMAGAAFKDEALFRQGLDKYTGLLSKFKNFIAFSSHVRINNEVMHHMLPGAEVLLLNGIDVFSLKYGKHTFHDTIENHANKVIKTGHKKVRTEAITDKVARSIMKAEGYGTHLAWIPVYLSTFSDTKAAASLVALDKVLRKSDYKDYYGTSLGIHSGCLFRM